MLKIFPLAQIPMGITSPGSGSPWANNTGNFQQSPFHLASQTSLVSPQLNSDAIHSEFDSQE